MEDEVPVEYVELSRPLDSDDQRSSSSHNPNISENITTIIKEVEPQARYRNLEDIYNSCSFALTSADPILFEEATKQDGWVDAMNEEMRAITKNETWALTRLPEGKRPIGLKWIYKTKVNLDGSIHRKKKRIVAKGYSQLEGIDLTEVYSPVARMETIRVFFAIAAQRKWCVHQLDVKAAFLNVELKEEVYVSQPEEFIVKGKEDHVYKLRKALYGLRQSPRAWYSHID